MANTSRFSALPNINIGRSRWNMNHDHPTSWEHGRIVPIDCVRVMPGDTFKLNLASLIRMSQPIVPIMDNIRCNYYAFFVPQRLVQDNCKPFFGENTTGAGPQLTPYYIPAAKFGILNASVYPASAGVFLAQPKLGSVSHYLHKPLCSGSEDLYQEDIMVSVLKERCYWLVYNEFFRPQQVASPVSLYKDDTAAIGILPTGFATAIGSTKKGIDFTTPCAITTKQFDYFTSSTISPQYGPSVEIPLGDYAPLAFLYADESSIDAAYTPKAFDTGTKKFGNPMDNPIVFGTDGSITPNNRYLFAVDAYDATLAGGGSPDVDEFESIDDSDFMTNFVVNLSQATAASINTLRAAFATQRFLERNNYGTRYHEYIQVHFGVTPPLGLLQVPELIGEHHFNINVQQVLSTAGAADDDTTKLGQPGANSVTGDKCMLFKKSFVEHGYILILMTTTHDRHYTSGILRDDLKREMLEFYHPEFATLGDQATKRIEIQYQNTSNGDFAANDVFGYQEHWAEYRYIPSQASGLLDPNAANGLSMWTLTNSYGVDVQFDYNFLLEDRAALANALVTGLTGPDYIGDFYFNYDVVRPMPLYSMPGRIDHVGGW